jgi:hypothetical protein
MKVTMGGHTASGRVSHAVFGEWTYSGENESWCGVTLSGNDHKMVGDVEVTCKRCIKQTPTFTTEQRNIAFEYLTAWRAGFDDGMAHQIRTKAVLDLWPGWPGGVADLARVILSGGK